MQYVVAEYLTAVEIYYLSEHISNVHINPHRIKTATITIGNKIITSTYLDNLLLHTETQQHLYDGFTADMIWNRESKCWWPNGNIRSVTNYIDDVRHGVCSHWYSDGHIKSSSDYDHGILCGVDITYHNDGHELTRVWYDG